MIGTNIKKIADQQNISIYKLIKKSKVSTGYMYDLVNGKQNNPSVKILRQISMALNVTMDELVVDKKEAS